MDEKAEIYYNNHHRVSIGSMFSTSSRLSLKNGDLVLGISSSRISTLSRSLKQMIAAASTFMPVDDLV
jgi:hypothetical protein